jgi:hypothetical protein
MRVWIALTLMAVSALAQSGVPTIAREGLTQRPDGRAVLLSPGLVMTFYGENLGPEPTCFDEIPRSGPYPLEACGVRVLVDGRPAGLLYVGPKQTNFKIPDDAPQDGQAPIQVCIRDTCSDPVVFQFSVRKAFVRLHGHAYVHMPVWIEVNQPWGDIEYPYSIFPLDFGESKIEVLHHGETQAPFRSFTNFSHSSTAAPPDSPRGLLPLHLIYRFDEPGVYSVRFTGRGYKYPGAIEVATQSDWIDIVVEPYSDSQRIAWLQGEAAKARSASVGELVGDIIPSLLASPDDAALTVLLTLVDHPDGMVQQYARMALDLFGEDVQKRVIPPNRWRDLHSRTFSILF